MECSFCGGADPFFFGYFAICASCARKATLAIVRERNEFHAKIAVGDGAPTYLYTAEKGHPRDRFATLAVARRTLDLIATQAKGPVVNGEQFAPGYTVEAAAYEQATRPVVDKPEPV